MAGQARERRKLTPELGIRILDDDGAEVVKGEVGRIHFKLISKSPFVYYKDPEKTKGYLR